jgi:hypothetical protein
MKLGKRSTEAQWLACTEPGNLLPFLRRKLGPRATDRKLLLFACACWRSISHLSADPRPRAAVEAVEQFLEGRGTLPQVNAALADAEAAVGQAGSDSIACASQAATFAASAVARRGPGRYDAYDAACDTFNAAAHAAANAAYDATDRESAAWGSAEWDGDRRQCDLLRDILGNPFRPLPPIAPSLLQSHDALVVRLAQAAYEQRSLPAGLLDNSRLAVLADALEEAGCQNEEVLGHLRGQEGHWRGCWVLDSLLGKS